MNKIKLSISLIIALVIVAFISYAVWQQIEPKGRIIGYAICDGQPQPQVKLYLSGSNFDCGLLVTDENGMYSAEVPFGHYTVYVHTRTSIYGHISYGEPLNYTCDIVIETDSITARGPNIIYAKELSVELLGIDEGNIIIIDGQRSHRTSKGNGWFFISTNKIESSLESQELSPLVSDVTFLWKDDVATDSYDVEIRKMESQANRYKTIIEMPIEGNTWYLDPDSFEAGNYMAIIRGWSNDELSIISRAYAFKIGAV